MATGFWGDENVFEVDRDGGCKHGDVLFVLNCSL